MTKERTWKVCIAHGIHARRISERLVGKDDRGLIVVWMDLRTGELVEQKYVRKGNRWIRYEDWLVWRRGELHRRAARQAPPPSGWGTWSGSSACKAYL
jgi:hypothetical protein